MKDLHFTTRAKTNIKEILESFFRQSESLGETTEGANPSNISKSLQYFLSNYSIKCSFGQGKTAKDTYIVFFRKDISSIKKASFGVYPRVCFHRLNNKIEVSISKSYKNPYFFKANESVKCYNKSHHNYFAYPNCDIEAIIAKLEKDLNFFLQIPANELEAL